MGVKIYVAHWGSNIDWQCLRIGCWGRLLGLGGNWWQGSGEDYLRRRFMICSPYQFYSGDQSKRLEGHVTRMWEKRGACSVLVGKRDGNIPLERLRRRWEDNVKRDRQEVGLGAWTKLIWLRIGTEDGLLWTRYWTSVSHVMRGGPWLAEELLASQKGFFSMELWCYENSYFCNSKTCCMNIDWAG